MLLKKRDKIRKVSKKVTLFRFVAIFPTRLYLSNDNVKVQSYNGGKVEACKTKSNIERPANKSQVEISDF